MATVVLRTLRSAIALGLMLWCAGAGCMVVSYAHGAMRSPAVSNFRSRGAGWNVTGSAGAHNCCRARHQSERRIDSSLPGQAPPSKFATKEIGLAEVPNQSDAMSCCPLTSGTFVVSSRQRASNDESSVPRAIDAVSIPNGPATAARSLVLHLPYQSQTHLRLCVFLI